MHQLIRSNPFIQVQPSLPNQTRQASYSHTSVTDTRIGYTERERIAMQREVENMNGRKESMVSLIGEG